MRSCLYEGDVYHIRRRPVEHRLKYHVTMACFDLDELETLLASRRLITDHPGAALSFPRGVHLRSESGTLSNRVRQFVARETGETVKGRVRLLTQLRYFGVYFSPLNLFFIEQPGEEFPSIILAEVNNIPWGEQHVYLLQPKWDSQANGWTCEHDKAFHVSPFMPMQHRYRWTFQMAGDGISVRLENLEEGFPLFEAGMNLDKKVLAPATLWRFKSRLPLMTWKIVAAIYLEAWKLWWKRCPAYPHPRQATPKTSRTAEVQPLGPTSAWQSSP